MWWEIPSLQVERSNKKMDGPETLTQWTAIWTGSFIRRTQGSAARTNDPGKQTASSAEKTKGSTAQCNHFTKRQAPQKKYRKIRWEKRDNSLNYSFKTNERMKFESFHMGATVRRIMKEKRITTADLARALNTHYNVIWKLLQKPELSVYRLQRISLRLGYDLCWYVLSDEKKAYYKKIQEQLSQRDGQAEEIAGLKAALAEQKKEHENREKEIEALRQENEYLKKINRMLEKK